MAIISTVLMLFAALMLIGPGCLGHSLKAMKSDRLWRKWKKANDAFFESQDDEFSRFKLFEHTRDYIEQFNEEDHGFLLDINKLADRTPEEVGATQFGIILPSERRRQLISSLFVKNRITKVAHVMPGEGLDWSERGAVTDVKDQGECRCSWAFAATGALESRLKLATGRLVSLSEQNLLDCAIDREAGAEACSGGWTPNAFNYIKSTGGLNTEHSYRYEQEDGNCRFLDEPSAKFAELEKTMPYAEVEPNNETAMIEALQSGPVVIVFDASDPSFWFYSSGIYSHGHCSPTRVNHAMLLVGYGTDAETEEHYWIVKNSWGTSWGEDGYIRVARGANMCGILSIGSYPILAASYYRSA